MILSAMFLCSPVCSCTFLLIMLALTTMLDMLHLTLVTHIIRRCSVHTVCNPLWTSFFSLFAVLRLRLTY